MSINSSFRKDIIQKSAELTSKNLDMVRLNNASIVNKPKPVKAHKVVNHERTAMETRVRQLQQKYLHTAEDPLSRKLFIKQIGSHI